MRQIQRRKTRRSYLSEEPDTEFFDPAIRRAWEAAEDQEGEDEGSGRPGNST